MYYGADVGTIGLAVFREKKVKDEPRLQTDDEEDMIVLSRGVFPNEKAKNLAALKAQLRTDIRRNLIEGGKTVDVETRKVAFKADPTPIMTATVTYYRPEK
jgi:hypothetical protein